ncbi:UbiA family prenyltransferase [Candidatus Micrarchaeota archaeon]|nr:UbiA family prenyltransferase [Candidatus Micrarchaeota archaeon]
MLKALLKLTRFEHAIMLALAVLIAETVVLGAVPDFTLIIALSLLVPVFSEMGSFALNDYLDIETDRINRRMGPLVTGTISPEFALYFSVAALVGSTVMAAFINYNVLIIALLFNFAAVLYNWKLKDLPLVGNFYIALTMAIPFIFGNYVVAEELSDIALVFAALGFVAGLAREIIKTVEDMEGDVKARKSKTLPVIIGKRRSLIAAIILYHIFIVLTIIPLIWLEASAFPVILVAIADVLVLFICYKTFLQDYRFARNASLVAFLIGLLGLLLASIPAF